MSYSRDRRAMILSLHRQGFTYRRIAGWIRLCPQRVAQLCEQAAREENQIDEEQCATCGKWKETMGGDYGLVCHNCYRDPLATPPVVDISSPATGSN